jgi:hypothetical protein
MKSIGFFLTGILGSMALIGAAGARSISSDTPNFQLTSTTGSTSSATLDITGYTLTFAPGTSATNSAYGALVPGISLPYSTAVNNYNASNAFMYNWGPNPTVYNASPPSITEQVDVYQLVNGQSLPVLGSSSTFTTNNAIEVDFNYASTSGCSGQTASLKVGTSSFSVKNPCGAGDNAFFFNTNANGQVVLEGTPSGWASTAHSTPEMDPNSAVTGLTLLLGGLAVLVGRRTRVAFRLDDGKGL